MASIANSSLPDHVLVFQGHHGTMYLRASGSNLLRLTRNLFNSDTARIALSQRISASHEDESLPAMRSHNDFWNCLLAVLTGEVRDSVARRLSRMFYGPVEQGEALRPVAIQPEWRKELLLWLVDNDPAGGANAPLKLAKQFADTDYMTETLQALSKKAYAELTFLQPARDLLPAVEFASSYDLEACQEYLRLTRDNWKDDVLEDPVRVARVFGNYVRFMNSLGEKFELEKMEAEVDWLFVNGNHG